MTSAATHAVGEKTGETSGQEKRGRRLSVPVSSPPVNSSAHKATRRHSSVMSCSNRMMPVDEESVAATPPVQQTKVRRRKTSTASSGVDTAATVVRVDQLIDAMLRQLDVEQNMTPASRPAMPRPSDEFSTAVNHASLD